MAEDFEADIAQQVEDLRRQLHASPGARAKARWDSLYRSVRVFQRNAHELEKTLAAAEHQEELAVELMQNVRPTEIRREYFGLLDQRLHNLIASAVSLVDHTRRMIKMYERTDFCADWTRRNESVRSAGGAAFLRDLRNYLVHYDVLAFVHSVRFPNSETESLVSQLRLDCAQLRTWDKWSAASKGYMAACDESVHLSVTVREYIDQMNDLYGWFFQQFEGLHGTDIDETNALASRINLTMTGGATDGRDWHARMAHIQENLRAHSEGREQTDYVPSEPDLD